MGITRSSLLFLVLVLGALPGLAASKPSAPAPLPADLPQRYADWLEEVAPLMSEEERQAFLALTQDYQRQAFLRAFWEARDPYPETPGNELRDAWQARVEEARKRYGTLADDRSRLLLLNGPPALVLTSRCGSLLRPIELWRMDKSSLVKGSFVLVFVARSGSRQGRYELWHPSEGIASLLLLGGMQSDEQLVDKVREDCLQAEELLSLLGSAEDWQTLEERGAKPHHPGTEWVQRFSAHSTALPADAALMPATVDLAFPGRRQSRTVVQGVVRVPATAAVAAGEKEEKLYRFLVDGEVLRKDELFESFRYRFEVPAADAPAQIPLLLERYLRPGDYRLLLRVEDLNGGSFFRHEGAISVPVVPATAATVLADAAPPPSEPAATIPAGAAAPAALASGAVDDDVVVQLSPPPADLL
ncbi:MAG TPA: GWxTD domain-containing protein, partial [Thermoanaerobaculia bacterium]|nr:GWxTD domain-containing protein [Thermoanaerobaculia bacterium]